MVPTEEGEGRVIGGLSDDDTLTADEINEAIAEAAKRRKEESVGSPTNPPPGVMLYLDAHVGGFGMLVRRLSLHEIVSQIEKKKDLGAEFVTFSAIFRKKIDDVTKKVSLVESPVAIRISTIVRVEYTVPQENGNVVLE